MSLYSLPALTNDSSLYRYIDQVNALPYLSESEEQALARRLVEKGDIDAAHQLVTSHLRYVVKIAMGYRHYGLSMLELISEGNIGLMQAVKKFDPKKGFRLSTYAVWWIKASIQEFVLKSWSLVKIGTTSAQKKLFFNLRRLKQGLVKLDNTSLTDDQVRHIATTLEVPEKEVIEMDRRLTSSDQSLNAPVIQDDSESGQLMDLLESEQESQEELLLAQQESHIRGNALKRALSLLNEREQQIIISRRLSDPAKTLDDLSKHFSVSRERVRQIENRAMEKLRQELLKDA